MTPSLFLVLEIILLLGTSQGCRILGEPIILSDPYDALNVNYQVPSSQHICQDSIPSCSSIEIQNALDSKAIVSFRIYQGSLGIVHGEEDSNYQWACQILLPASEGHQSQYYRISLRVGQGFELHANHVLLLVVAHDYSVKTSMINECVDAIHQAGIMTHSLPRECRNMTVVKSVILGPENRTYTGDLVWIDQSNLYDWSHRATSTSRPEEVTYYLIQTKTGFGKLINPNYKPIYWHDVTTKIVSENQIMARLHALGDTESSTKSKKWRSRKYTGKGQLTPNPKRFSASSGPSPYRQDANDFGQCSEGDDDASGNNNQSRITGKISIRSLLN